MRNWKHWLFSNQNNLHWKPTRVWAPRNKIDIGTMVAETMRNRVLRPQSKEDQTQQKCKHIASVRAHRNKMIMGSVTGSTQHKVFSYRSHSTCQSTHQNLHQIVSVQHSNSFGTPWQNQCATETQTPHLTWHMMFPIWYQMVSIQTQDCYGGSLQNLVITSKMTQ